MMLQELTPLVLDLEHNRRELYAVTTPLSEDEMNIAPREGEYSGRQVLAHLAGAERGMTGLMKRMAAGKEPKLGADYNNDYFNARQQEKRAAMSVAALRAELEGSRRELLAFMETLRAEDLDKRGEHPIVGDATVRKVIETLSAHEKEHADAFGKWAKQLRPNAESRGHAPTGDM